MTFSRLITNILCLSEINISRFGGNQCACAVVDDLKVTLMFFRFISSPKKNFPFFTNGVIPSFWNNPL